MTEILLNLGGGFVNALQPLNCGMIVLGMAIGILAGALPGITMLNAIMLVLPFTPGPLLFTMQPEQVYTIIAGMILANFIMVVLGFLAALAFAKLM